MIKVKSTKTYHLSDDVFIKIFRKYEQRIKIIEKKEKLAAVEEKFEKKGVQCPNCNSFQCIKNGTKDYKQRYKN